MITEFPPSTELVERDTALQAMQGCLALVAGGTGHTVFVAGEAGIGKTSVLKALVQRRGDAQLWWGACDAFQTPHPLSSLQDIARSADVRFRALLGPDTARAALFEAVLSELQHSPVPTLLVIEDVHWADDATIDFLRFLGRRIDRARCLLVISYRDDELAPSHPLRHLLGDLPSSLVTRIELPRLSPQGVEVLARRAFRPATDVHSVTHGNPFFVSELLRNAPEGVPRSVNDLVLARLARLGPGAQAIVKLASVAPSRIECWLAERLVDMNVALVEECLNSGLLATNASDLCFRHELARVAVETSLPGPVAQLLHAQVLGVLTREEGRGVSLARLVHHATRAGDVEAVLAWAPEAARQAQQRGAHREAAAHFRTALDHAEPARVGDAQRAQWLEGYALECQLTEQLEQAIHARLRLQELYTRSGDTRSLAVNLSQLALVHVPALQNTEADEASRMAISLLETLEPGAELADAYRVEAQLRMLNRECEVSVDWGREAVGLAERAGNPEVLAASISTLGAATIFIDYDRGHEHLKRALGLALEGELHYVAANTYNNLGAACGEVFRLDDAQRYLKEAIAFTDRHEIDLYRNYCVSLLSVCDMYQGRWDDASEHAQDVLEFTPACSTSRLMAMLALGRINARRGAVDARETLDVALFLAQSSDTLQHVAPVRAARAEAAFLRGDLALVAHEAESALALARKQRHRWFAGELAYWMHRAGAADDVSDEWCAEPYLLQIDGRWREAAQAWSALGCPYERARALSEGDDAARLEAVALFEQLGATAAAQALRRELRAAGFKRVPRGLRASTQANPHQLTAREIEVLQLLCEGLKNSEIAEKLFRSVRTVDHHLAAIFSKLGVTSRTEAVSAAFRGGLHVAQNRQALAEI
jgi:DNA-binding CsgD family transcriptional regulator